MNLSSITTRRLELQAFITGTRNQHLRGNRHSEKFELLKDKMKSL